MSMYKSHTTDGMSTIQESRMSQVIHNNNVSLFLAHKYMTHTHILHTVVNHTVSICIRAMASVKCICQFFLNWESESVFIFDEE